MQGRASDELAIGSKFVSHRRTITEADVTLFTALTWITDPIFTDDVFASSTQFGRRVAPGPLLMAFALGLTEELVYGTTLAAMGINNALFRKPVAPGSTIYVETVIGGTRESASRPGTSIVQFKHEVFCHGSTDVVASFERNMLLGSRRFLDDLARERESVR